MHRFDSGIPHQSISTMNKPFYTGSYREAGLNGPNRGWVVGDFQDPPISPPRNSHDVEIKYWEYLVGPTDHPMKKLSIIECTLILKGKTLAMVDGEEVILNADDYIVIEPGTPNNTVAKI